MIIVPGEQGTPEWAEMRLGIPTASCFDRIVTPSGGLSSQADQYMAECVAEWVTGESAGDWGGNTDTERGHLFEPDARATYEWETGNEVEEAAFVYKDDQRLVGCSPDGLLNSGKKVFDADTLVPVHDLIGGVEIKCPRATIHVAYLVLGVAPKKYMPQVQGSMWVCDCDFWDFVSYHQNYDPLIVRVERDEKFTKALDKAIPTFIDQMMTAREIPRFIEMRDMRLEAYA